MQIHYNVRGYKKPRQLLAIATRADPSRNTPNRGQIIITGWPSKIKEDLKMFENLRKAVEAEAAERERVRRFYIEKGYCPTWAEGHRQNPDKGLQEYSTPAKWAAYQAGSLSREKAVEIASRRGLKEITTWKNRQLSKLATAAAAGDLELLTVSVEWRKSRTWGANPTATAYIYGENAHTGTASGCGYDKESAAVAEALNQSPAVMKVLYQAAERALKDGKSFTRFSNGNVHWGDVLGYGSGYAIVPYFEGGVGVSCFWSILRDCGYQTHRTGTGKMYDHYTVTRRA